MIIFQIVLLFICQPFVEETQAILPYFLCCTIEIVNVFARHYLIGVRINCGMRLAARDTVSTQVP